MKKLFASLCGLCALAFSASAQTAVLFPLAQMTGTTNDTDITIKPINNPVKFNSRIYWLPTAGITLHTTNGSASTNLIPNDYNVSIKGVPGSWKISVNDTNVMLNAAEIGNLTTYTFTDLFGYVKKIVPGTGISISPVGGQGTVTINNTGSGSGGSALFYPGDWTTWSLFNGSNVVNITGPLTDFAKLTTNAFDTAGAAAASTNAAGISSGLAAYRQTNSFDVAGAAIAATNGWPWGVLYDSAGAATAATNGYPWGSLYDPIGRAVAVTNGYPWGALYDGAGAGTTAATAATNALNPAAFGKLATSTNAGLLNTNEYSKLLSFPHANDAFLKTPPVVYNDYYAIGGFSSQHNSTNDKALISIVATNGVLAMANAFGTPVYFFVDDGWQDSNSAPNGIFQSDLTRFPNGMKELSDYAHGFGMKFGVYGIGSSQISSLQSSNFYGNATNALAQG